MTVYESQTDENGRCLGCGYTLDVDATGHDEECRLI